MGLKGEKNSIRTMPSPFLEKPDISTLVLMFVLTLVPLFDAGFDHNIIYWMTFLLLGISLARVFKEDINFSFDLRTPNFWFACFLIWAGLSLLWSVNPHRSLIEFIQLVLFGSVFFLSTQQDENRVYKIGRIVIICGVLIGLFGIIKYLFVSSGRISSTFTNPNPLGIYLAMIFFFGWGYYLRKPKVSLGIASVFLLVGLALTGSRGSFIVFIISIPILFWGMPKIVLRKSILKTTLVILIALLIAQGIMLSAPHIQGMVGHREQLSQFLTRPHSFIASSGVGRLAFMEVGGRVALREPVRGFGLGTFYLSYVLEYMGDRWYSRFAHNHYIQTAAELGLIGLFLFLLFVFFSLMNMLIVLKGNYFPVFFPGMVGAAVAFLLHIGGDFSWNFPGVTVVFFGILGVTCNNFSNKEKLKGKKSRGRKRVFGILVISLLFLLTTWQFLAINLYQKGINLENRGKLEEPVLIYEKANKIYPINPIAYSFASRIYKHLGEEQNNKDLIERAYINAKKAVELSPIDGNLHNQLGWFYWEEGNFEMAEKHLSLGVRFGLYQTGLYLDLGWFYIERGDLKAAQKVFVQGLEFSEVAKDKAQTVQSQQNIKRQILDIHALLGRIYIEFDDMEKASYHLEKAGF